MNKKKTESIMRRIMKDKAIINMISDRVAIELENIGDDSVAQVTWKIMLAVEETIEDAARYWEWQTNRRGEACLHALLGCDEGAYVFNVPLDMITHNYLDNCGSGRGDNLAEIDAERDAIASALEGAAKEIRGAIGSVCERSHAEPDKTRIEFP
jgi:hypothetical protein